MHKALTILEGKTTRSVNLTQNLRIEDELAEVFREKPVVILQLMDVRIIQANNVINEAVRALDKLELQAVELSLLE